MTDREARKLFFDIQEAASAIAGYLVGVESLEAYERQRMLMRAVEREFMIIGEAMNKLLRLEPTLPIASARQVVNLRNLLAHAYDDTDQQIIWDIIQQHLPLLRQEVADLLEERD